LSYEIPVGKIHLRRSVSEAEALELILICPNSIMK
jgi:hypothetical protein